MTWNLIEHFEARGGAKAKTAVFQINWDCNGWEYNMSTCAELADIDKALKSTKIVKFIKQNSLQPDC